MFDVNKIRQDFPILHQKVRDRPLIYFDNAATTQKPRQVIDVITAHYQQDNANVHRGVHVLSERSTKKFNEARVLIQQFVNAKYVHEIIFTKGATEAINLVAHSFGQRYLREGDEIVVSHSEHHSNIVPWQIACEKYGCLLKVIPIQDSGEIILEEYQKLLSSKTKLVAIGHVSNALGTVHPIQEMIRLAHDVGAVCLVDGAQAMAHFPIDVQALECDFYVGSGHKMLGPTGIGILYGKSDLLEAMPPYQFGGDMIRRVSFSGTTYNTLPFKFEAGTPPILGAIGLAEAVRYLMTLGLENIAAYEHELLMYATKKLIELPEIKLIGTAKNKSAILSFLFKDVHAHDVSTILDNEGIAIRSGHHCAMPLMDRLGVHATSRASFAFYNTKEEIDAFVLALAKIKEVFYSCQI